jgi:hypothetical protein
MVEQHSSKRHGRAHGAPARESFPANPTGAATVGQPLLHQRGTAHYFQLAVPPVFSSMLFGSTV